MKQSHIVHVKVPITNVIVTDGDYSGYRAGYCIACNASGWIDGFGYPFGTKGVVPNHLIHKKSCPMNELLTRTGEIKRRRGSA